MRADHRSRLDLETPGAHVQAAYSLAALGFAAFTLYGSLVPFDSVPLDFGEALSKFSWVCRTRVGVDSRGDWLANCLLGAPLGFCLVGALRVRNRPGPFDWAATFAAVAITTLYALFVEFLQLYFPSRTSSLNDVLAQGAGGFAGATGWLVAGRELTRRARLAWADPRSGGVVGQLLFGYCLGVLVVQTLPWDITTSPAELYHRLRDGPGDGRITLAPFADFPGPGTGIRLQTWLELVGLFLPAGLLASRLPAALKQGVGVVFAAALLFALATEATQTLVSRHPSTSDAIVGAIGAALGFLAGRARGPLVSILLLGWVGVLVFTHWRPFAFASELTAASWIPFADSQSQNYLGALDGILSRAIMFAPVGVAVPARGYGAGRAALAGLLLAGVLELGQLALPERRAATTELFTGSAAAFAGALAARRLARAEVPPR